MATKKNAKAKPAKKAATKPKPAAKKPVAKKPAPKAKPVKKPVAKAKPAKKVAKPAPKKGVKPVSKVKPKPAPKKIAKPVVKAKAKPAKAVKKVAVKAKPVAKAKAVKTAKKATKVVVKKVAPATKKVAPKIPTPAPKAKPQATPKAIQKPTPAPVVAKPVIKTKPAEATKPAHIISLKPEPPVVKPTEVRPVVKPSNKKEDSSSMAERYSDKDLKEFEGLIHEKLKQAKSDLEELKQSLSHESDNSTDDTSPTFKMMEDGSDTMNREELAQLASRQEKFIQNLDNALLRIKNKTYGICRVTGKLIPKERLRLVPHATLSIEAKNMQ